MYTLLIFTIGFILILTIIIFWSFSSYNLLVQLQSLAKDGYSQINNQLVKYYNLISNFTELVNAYSIEEIDVLENIEKAKSALISARTVKAKAKAKRQLTTDVNILFGIIKNYPYLKNNENFIHLQYTFDQIEKDLQLASHYYNGAAKNFNDAKKSFPTNLIAKIAKLGTLDYFVI